MKLYKLRHKPTGLFYAPTKGLPKSNLFKDGKIYKKKPSAGYMYSGLYIGEWKDSTDESRFLIPYKIMDLVKEDWEIVEYTVVETATYNL